MKKYTTMITKDYVPDWTTSDGIREYITNALDSPMNFEYEVNQGSILLTSKGITLPTKVLTLGTSDNRSNSNAVGTHGEGILVGMVPILRDGGSITLHNGSVKWTADFEYSEDFERDILVITETSGNNGNDYSVEINCDHSYIETAIDRCLYLQEDVGEILEGERGRILKDIQGKLYVGGVFVCDIKGYEYSFDFKPQYLPLNRDRKSVNNWDLNYNTSILVKETLDFEAIANLVEKNAQDIQNLQHRDGLDDLSDVLYDRLVDKYGEDVVICEWYDDKTDLESKGYTNVVNVSHSNYHNIVNKSPKYQEKLEQLTEELDIPKEDDRTPIEMLEEWAKRNVWSEWEDLMELFNKRGLSFDK